ncbi:hypothetical protein BGZ70_000657, partial [Mortierella alpina]
MVASVETSIAATLHSTVLTALVTVVTGGDDGKEGDEEEGKLNLHIDLPDDVRLWQAPVSAPIVLDNRDQ